MITMNPDKILIQPRTFIAVCGLPNSGKTTFCEKHFKRENIVSSDRNINDIAEKLLSSLNESLGISPDSDPEWVMIVNHLRNIALLKNEQISRNEIIAKSEILDYVVLDSLNYNCINQFPTVELAYQHFANNMAIYFDIPEDKLLQRPKKELSSSLAALGFSNDFAIELLSSEFRYEVDVNLKRSFFQEVYLITDENIDVKVVIS